MTGAGRSWEIRYDQRPWVQNAERRNHWAQRWDTAREWRKAFWALALHQRIPRLDVVTLTVQSTFAKGVLPDTCADYPAFKSALDGIVDAGVLADDDPQHVREVTFSAPSRGPDGMTVTITEHVK